MKNLAAHVFTILRDMFFDESGNPKKFDLREKSITQDDPFDEYVAASLDEKLKTIGARCQKSSGPLISPDMAVYTDTSDIYFEKVINNPDALIGIEVKKLERGKNGAVARPTGMDYNSTPPCGKMRIYSSEDKPMEIKGYYLFACLEKDDSGKSFVSAMTLCDGSILNDDFNLYMQITGSREKGINLGTYGDGANRNRPMLIFSNPLGSDLLDHRISLISGVNLGEKFEKLKLSWRFIRKDTNGTDHVFYTYLDERDFPNGHSVIDIHEPFPTPTNRVRETRGRGKFRLLKYYEEYNALCKKRTND